MMAAVAPAAAKLDSLLKQHTASDTDTKDKLLGASLVVVDSNSVLYSGGAGRTSLDTKAAPFTADTVSWIASMTKVIATTAVLQLVDKKIISLDDDVRGVLPELAALPMLTGFDEATNQPILEPFETPITLGSLLNHTNGTAYDVFYPELLKWMEVTKRSINSFHMTMEGFQIPMLMQPGKGWRYGYGIDWAGIYLERTLSTPEKKVTLNNYIQENIFRPLGIPPTQCFYPSADTLITQFVERAENGTLKEGEKIGPIGPNCYICSGGAGLHMTTANYAKFLQGILTKKIISEDTYKLMFSDSLIDPELKYSFNHSIFEREPEMPPAPWPITHSYGGMLTEKDVPYGKKKGTLMWSGIVNPRWWIDPTTGIAAVLMCNVSPYQDPVLKKLYVEVEKVIYDDLLKA